VDQSAGTPGHQPRILPIDPNDSDQYSPNPDFGHLYQSFPQEGIDSNRSIRLRGRITF
jgi:hypothetical protein